MTYGSYEAEDLHIYVAALCRDASTVLPFAPVGVQRDAETHFSTVCFGLAGVAEFGMPLHVLAACAAADLGADASDVSSDPAAWEQRVSIWARTHTSSSIALH